MECPEEPVVGPSSLHKSRRGTFSFVSRQVLLPVCLTSLILAPRAIAQDIADQFLPEINVRYELPPGMAVWFQAKTTRENGDPTQAEVGPSFIYTPSNMFRFGGTAMPMTLSIGYRYVGSPDAATINRMVPMVALGLPFERVRVSDRNRADLDWQSRKFSWRYRNRLNVAYPWRLRRYEATPYVSAESYYTSQYGKWSDTALHVGCKLPIRKHSALNIYYEHQNTTGKKPNEQYRQLGLMLNLTFGTPRRETDE